MNFKKHSKLNWKNCRAVQDIIRAMMLLTRLPLPKCIYSLADGPSDNAGRGLWAFPLVGLILGASASCLAVFLSYLGIHFVLIAILLLSCIIIWTGAMHEDGFADAADGLWGGWTVERRLEIMKDSHIGAYGTLALILSIALRCGALALLVQDALIIPSLIAVMTLARCSILPIMAILPQARASGLSHHVGRPCIAQLTIAAALSITTVFACFDWTAFTLITICFCTSLIWLALIKHKVGGQTGDLLGACIQLNEIVLLISLTIL